MQPEPLDVRLRRGFATLRRWEEETERIYATSPHRGRALIPIIVAEQINELLQDLAEAGADQEWISTFCFHPRTYIEARKARLATTVE